MSAPIPRYVVETFYQALVAACAMRDLARIAPFLHDDVEWTINGPVDVLAFCGVRRGKAAVLDLIARVVPAVYRVTNFVREELLVDGERAAALVRVTGIQRGTGASISYRVAQFMRFRDGQVAEFLAVIDSFDAAEQVLGRPIEVESQSQQCSEGARGDLVEV
jgi:ketosteroid isomerase-like protein